MQKCRPSYAYIIPIFLNPVPARLEKEKDKRTVPKICRFDSEDEMARVLELCYWSLWECGGGIIAEGNLLDCIRRLYAFGLSLLKMDIRQESNRHSELLAGICTHLDCGDYAAWSEAERLTWLVR